jgi:hypothetical protein
MTSHPKATHRHHRQQVTTGDFPTWGSYQIHSFYGKWPVVTCVTCGQGSCFTLICSSHDRTSLQPLNLGSGLEPLATHDVLAESFQWVTGFVRSVGNVGVTETVAGRLSHPLRATGSLAKPVRWRSFSWAPGSFSQDRGGGGRWLTAAIYPRAQFLHDTTLKKPFRFEAVMPTTRRPMRQDSAAARQRVARRVRCLYVPGGRGLTSDLLAGANE